MICPQCGYDGIADMVSTACHGGTDAYDVAVCPKCKVPMHEEEEITAREHLAESLKQRAELTHVEALKSETIDGAYRLAWLAVADHVLKREIEAIITEVKYYQKMFSKSKHEYIFTERVNALNRQLKDTDR